MPNRPPKRQRVLGLNDVNDHKDKDELDLENEIFNVHDGHFGGVDDDDNRSNIEDAGDDQVCCCILFIFVFIDIRILVILY